MNRRDMLERFAATLVGSSLVATVDEVKAESPQEAIAVIHCDLHMTAEHRERIKRAWVSATEGTHLDGMKVLVLDRGLRLTVERA